MTSLAEVRTELASVLGTIDGWTVFDGYVGDSVPHPYSFKVARPAFDPRTVFGESKRFQTFAVTAYAPRQTPATSEARLDELCDMSGPKSLIEAVQDGTRWELTVDYAQVTRCGEVQVITWIDGVEFLACQFQIEVVW